MQSVIISVAALTALAAAAYAADTTQPAAATPAASTTQPGGAALTTQYQQASYGIGYDLGKNIKETNVPIEPDLIVQGLRDCLANQENRVSPEQFAAAMQQVQADMVKNAGKLEAEFRARNAARPGVKTTNSGLQFETVAEGTGATPTATDTVKVHYTGKLVNGRTFDSSVDRGEPATFPVNGVIPGWTEALQMMKVGGKAHLIIPPELGYGARGAAPSIPPNATLVFDVELLGIEKK